MRTSIRFSARPSVGVMGVGPASEPLILIPEDKARKHQTVAVRAYYATRWLWSRGIYPGVAAVSIRMHGHERANLNDRETSARRKAMQQLGIPYQRPGLVLPGEGGK